MLILSPEAEQDLLDIGLYIATDNTRVCIKYLYVRYRPSPLDIQHGQTGPIQRPPL